MSFNQQQEKIQAWGCDRKIKCEIGMKIIKVSRRRIRKFQRHRLPQKSMVVQKLKTLAAARPLAECDIFRVPSLSLSKHSLQQHRNIKCSSTLSVVLRCCTLKTSRRSEALVKNS